MAYIKKQDRVREAKAELIRRGHVAWMLHAGQKELFDNWAGSDKKITVWNCARRFGKSYLLTILAFQYCMKNPGVQVRYAAATQKQVKSIIIPLIDQIIAEFPDEVRPTHANSIWSFPNGAKLMLAAADYKDGDALRGVASHLVLVDEAGFVKKLRYLVQDILLPQLLTTNGRLIMASTPPRSIAHEFVEYVQQAVAQDSYSKKTIFDNPRLTSRQINDVITECGGKESDTFKREYMCELISDSSARIIPEFREKSHVQKQPIPQYYQPYVAADFGLKDYTAIIFGYLDFVRQKIVIQGEAVFNYRTTKEMAIEIQRIEEKLWKGHSRQPIRIGDNELQILWDLQKDYKITFKPATKWDKEAAIASLRDGFIRDKLEIWPECKNLVHQLNNGVWNEARTGFERNDSLGHCDAVDALIYLFRHVNWKLNPIPERAADKFNEFIPSEKPSSGAGLDAWRKIFKLKNTNN